MNNPNNLHERAVEICNQLPAPDYTINFQPTFPDKTALVHAIAEILEFDGITNPQEIAFFRSAAATAQGIVIFGNCNEPVQLSRRPDEHCNPVLEGLEIVQQSALAGALAVYRGMGQSSKPRSSATEVLSDGSSVPSYFGDDVNSTDPTLRTPCANRMVHSVIQAHLLRTCLSDAMQGMHIPSAHEMLLLAKDVPFIRQDPESGKLHLLSADLPWVGVRTNAADGIHVQTLAQVENSVGVKIDHTSTDDHIRDLSNALDPRREPGKLLFMIRVALSQNEDLDRVVRSIARHNPEARILYDMHGATKTSEEGQKIRSVPGIKNGITQLAETLEQHGLALHGGHFETTHRNRQECIDSDDELPLHEGNIDPQLNPRQTTEILNHLANHIPSTVWQAQPTH